MYQVPIASPPLVIVSGNTSGGNALLKPSPTVGLTYDVGQEFPADPVRQAIAWANCNWVAVGTYNGK